MTCYDSGNGRSFILGRKYLSLERYFHKEISRVQSIWYAQQVENGIKYLSSSKHIKRLYRKKQNAVRDYLHKVTRWLAEYCKKERISCVIIGDIRNIRKEKDMGQCQAEPIFVSSDGKAARAAGLFPVVNGSGFMPVMRQ